MTPTTILIFGRGQLGNWYQQTFSQKGITTNFADADIRQLDQVRTAITTSKPDLVINTVGKTNIDWCEQNREETFAVNVLGADNIARVCQENSINLVHISSGCVQESTSAEHTHDENDLPNPVCFYAWTKVWGDNLVMDRITRHGLKAMIIRPRQLLSAQLSPRNALVKMLTYSKFIDTPNSCTVIEDLMDVTSHLIEANATGIINVVNPGVTSPLKIAKILQDHVKPDMEIIEISKSELDQMTFAKRIDAVLTTKKMNSYGISLRPIEERLIEIADQLKINLASASAVEIMTKTTDETRAKLALVNS